MALDVLSAQRAYGVVSDTVFAALVLVATIAAASVLYRRLSARKSPPPQLTPNTPSASRLGERRPPSSPTASSDPNEPGTERAGTRRRRKAPHVEPPRTAAHRRVAEGRPRPEDIVPPVVLREPEVDWRPRVVRPFELSLFHSQIDALELSSQSAWRALLFGKWRWYDWLAEPGRLAGVTDALKAMLRGAPEPERSDCLAQLDAWFVSGGDDRFLDLRETFRAIRSLPLPRVHVLEADAAEYRFGDEWLVATVLLTLVRGMVVAGVLRQKPPSLRCCISHQKFVEDITGATGGPKVKLACYLPCSHWADHESWEEWRDDDGRADGDDHCPECGGLARACVVQEYAGRMVDSPGAEESESESD